MKTDNLIAALAADTRTEQPPQAVLWPALVVALGAAVVAVRVGLGFRDDLLLTLVEPLAAMRYVLTAALGVLGVRLALVLGRPEGRSLARLWPVLLPVLAALGLLAWARPCGVRCGLGGRQSGCDDLCDVLHRGQPAVLRHLVRVGDRRCDGAVNLDRRAPSALVVAGGRPSLRVRRP